MSDEEKMKFNFRSLKIKVENFLKNFFWELNALFAR